MWEALANLVYDLIVKAAVRRGKGVLVGGWVSKWDIFNLSGLSDDHLQCPILLYNYSHQRTLLPLFIPITCGTAPLQLCNTVGSRHTVLISGHWIRNIYFCFINVIKCFVKCNVSIKCNVRVTKKVLPYLKRN